MNDISVRSESRYPVHRKKIRKKIEVLLAKKKIVDEVEISIAFVGDRKMKVLNKKYREKEETTPVLAFPLDDPKTKAVGRKFPFPFSSPDHVLRLGDIVISYPQAVKMAVNEEKLVDEVIDELVEHGMEKLLGNNF